jgi:hypothetical protein
MRRLTRGGGTVASAVFDFWGGFSAADLVCDIASVRDASVSALAIACPGCTVGSKSR